MHIGWENPDINVQVKHVIAYLMPKLMICSLL